MKSKTKTIAIILVAFATTLQGQSKTAAEMLARVSRMGDLKKAESFISAGVDPNLSDQYGRTPLYYAALFNRNEMAALLLAHKADPNTPASGPTSGSEFAQTPLQIAASMGNLRMASMLVDAGAHANAKTKAGRVALHFAAIGSHLDLIRFLIKRGAEVNTRDGDGISPLDEAVWRGHLEATAILLAKGARLNEPEIKTGATPINEAAHQGKTQLVQYLLQFGPNLETPDRRGYTPLENAIRTGNAQTALVLLNVATPQQKTPEFLKKLLNASIKEDESVMIEALLRRGARANDTLPSGATLLDAAAYVGAANAVRVLLNHDADSNGQGRNGVTPLEEASLRGFCAIAEMLLDHGARVNEVNTESGTTALYAATRFGKGDVVKLLLQRGAHPNACGKGRTTPYKTARDNGFSEIATQIQHYGGSTEYTPEEAGVH